MENEFLSIKEFAELANVSVQSIYKKINKDNNIINNYVKEIDGIKYINKIAYDIIYNNTASSNEIKDKQTSIDDEEISIDNKSIDRLLDILEKQIEEQKRQLIEKDKQIEEKDKQINSLLSRLEETTLLIDQQQKLTAINTKKDLDLLTAEKENKKGFWERLKGVFNV